jgi:hypothetical protein
MNDLSDLNEEEFRTISHDMVLFNLKLDMSEAEFYVHLRSQFNNHPFVIKFKDFVKSRPNSSIHYGGCVSWIQENTTTVPTPRSWEMKKQYIINNLYEWVCFFDLEFSFEVPIGGHSQILTFKGF